MKKNSLKILALILLSLQGVCLGQPLWSILICTLDERKAQFEKLYTKLQRQIERASLVGQVEIVWISDNRQMPTGTKRNKLLDKSQGKYVCFCDDDDDVHDKYVEMIYEQLLTNPDCVNLIGIITFNGKNPKMFFHSIKYNDKYCEENGMYYRPPNHLNPIRRSIAIQVRYPDIYYGEDAAWALELARRRLIKTEATVKKPYYFYKYVDK